MDRIPLLRHQVMVLFHTFKEERKEMIERAMKEKGAGFDKIRR
jgi:hypothetical protein